MTRRLLPLLVLLALAAGALPVAAEPGLGGFSSPNLTWLLNLRNEAPGVSGTVHEMPDGERRFYISSVQGLTVYNIDDPGIPVPLGHLELPNWENEDVSISADGQTVLMSEFTASGYLHVFTVTEVETPLGLNPVVIAPADTVLLEGDHISNCMDPACDTIYGSDGNMWDASDKTDIQMVEGGWGAILQAQGAADTSGHNVEQVGQLDRDGDGVMETYAITDTTPMNVVDVTDPRNPILVGGSLKADHAEYATAYQHNTRYPAFDQYRPRTPSDVVGPANDQLRPGELVMGNGETNFTGTCDSGSGPFTTWSAVNWDRGEPFRVLDVFRPVNGTYDGNGDPAVNALGCSGHWFAARPDDADPADYLVAAAWYEHGTRILHVDGQTGQIEQRGYYQPVQGSASQATWIVDDSGTFVYTIDYQRGVDILRYTPDAPMPSQAEFDASWLLASPVVRELSAQVRYVCDLALRGR